MSAIQVTTAAWFTAGVFPDGWLDSAGGLWAAVTGRTAPSARKQLVTFVAEGVDLLCGDVGIVCRSLVEHDAAHAFERHVTVAACGAPGEVVVVGGLPDSIAEAPAAVT